MIDPFEIKKYPKWHPFRLYFTAYARLQERESQRNFGKYALPIKKDELQKLPTVPFFDTSNTTVTVEQMQLLLHSIESTNNIPGSVIVEVGSFRGVSTRCLASSTGRTVIAVDPFIGYGGSEEEYQLFKKNTAEFQNVVHLRQTSGTAASLWNYEKIGLIFIDALHDYVNTKYDLDTWFPLVERQGLMAFHDTDTLRFAGTRRAVYESASRMRLFAHVDGLTIFQKL